MSSASRIVQLLSSAFLLLYPGCAEPRQSSKPPTMPAPDANGTYSVDWPDLGSGEDRFINIELGDDFEACRRNSPKFEFDSAKTRAQDRAQLVALSSCLNHPGMENRFVLLIGRTDERGTDAYNQQLGIKRAKRIKDLLVANGLAENRIKIESRGENNAVGASPDYSYGYDRRVDVVVRGGVHAP